MCAYRMTAKLTQYLAASLPHLMARHMTLICWIRSRTASMEVRAPRRCTRREMAMLPPTAAMEPASSLRALFACRCASCGTQRQTTCHEQPSGRQMPSRHPRCFWRL